MSELTKVLEQWKEGHHYWPMPWPPLAVCTSYDSGFPLENIIPRIAQEVGGFAVYRAVVQLQLEGYADDSQAGYNARRRRDNQDWDCQTQGFAPAVTRHSESKRIVVSGMTPVGDSTKKTTLGGKSFRVSADCLTQKTLFDEDNTPADEATYDGFLGGSVCISRHFPLKI